MIWLNDYSRTHIQGLKLVNYFFNPTRFEISNQGKWEDDSGREERKD